MFDDLNGISMQILLFESEQREWHQTKALRDERMGNTDREK